MPEAHAPARLKATLNFARERRDDYVFSNYHPAWRTLETTPHAVEMHDARDLTVPPTLAQEGFEIHRLPVAQPDWENNDWVQMHYVPRVQELVLKATGGDQALTFPGSWVYRNTGVESTAPAALYVHMDREYENCRQLVRNHFDEAVWSRYSRFEVINVWRSLTPPPQDYPLAFCDQRTNDRTDWITCLTREPQLAEEMKHTVAVSNEGHRWYFFSDMTPDEVVVFRNYNDDEHGVPGCLHTAFHDETVRDAVPRASFEIRFYVFYNE